MTKNETISRRKVDGVEGGCKTTKKRSFDLVLVPSVSSIALGRVRVALGGLKGLGNAGRGGRAGRAGRCSAGASEDEDELNVPFRIGQMTSRFGQARRPPVDPPGRGRVRDPIGNPISGEGHV